jgi:hypothetical protein
MMSGDRSVQVGAALLGLGGAAVLARLGYLWASSGGHFWNVWTILGVVVGGLGFVIMVVGWVMPSEKSSPSQLQVGGDRSTNIQAGRDITLRGDEQAGE